MIFYTRTPEAIENCIKEIQKLEGVWKITIAPEGRTLPQNDYFHAILDVIAPVTGHTKEDLKELLKAELLGMREVYWQGKTYPLPIKSSSLNKTQFSVLIEKVLQVAQFLGVILPSKDYYGYK